MGHALELRERSMSFKPHGCLTKEMLEMLGKKPLISTMKEQQTSVKSKPKKWWNIVFGAF